MADTGMTSAMDMEDDLTDTQEEKSTRKAGWNILKKMASMLVKHVKIPILWHFFAIKDVIDEALDNNK